MGKDTLGRFLLSHSSSGHFDPGASVCQVCRLAVHRLSKSQMGRQAAPTHNEPNEYLGIDYFSK